MSRHIPLEGASNFRDFGGYRTADGGSVAWRRLFRSDRLFELTGADYALLSEHQIRLVCDLRRDSEVQAEPTSWPGADAPEIVRSPLFGDEAGPSTFQRIAVDEAARRDADLVRSIMSEMYLRLVSEPGPLAIYRGMLDRLAQPASLPVLLHCSGGKDRTGVTCALILLALGVSRQDVIDDFMLSRDLYHANAQVRARISQVVASSVIGDWNEEALAPIFSVEQAYLERALAHIDSCGGIEPFLVERVGVSQDTLAGVRAALLA